MTTTIRPDYGSFLPGVDVSCWQGRVDWVVAAASGRCRFAYVKATEGASLTDERFAENWAGTLTAGVPRGAYHFMLASVSAESQAMHFLDTYPGGGELPPALDLEWGVHGAVPDAVSALEWLRAVRAELGVAPIVYTSPAFAALALVGEVGLEITSGYELWVAHYCAGGPTVPSGWSDWRVWQRGVEVVPGFRRKVDVNLMRPSPTRIS